MVDKTGTPWIVLDAFLSFYAAQRYFVVLRSSAFLCSFTQLFWWSNTCMTLSWIFDAPGSNDGGYCFCPVCFSVWLLVRLLSTLTFTITFESLEIGALYMAYIVRQQWRRSATKEAGGKLFSRKKWKQKKRGGEGVTALRVRLMNRYYR